MRIHLDGEWTRFSTHFIDAVIDIFQWIAGIFLGLFIYSYVTRWLLENIKIDYEIPQSYMVRNEIDGKKWLVVNPSDRWNLLEAVFIYITWKLGKKYKDEIQESDIKRVKLIRRIWLVTGAIIFLLGTASAFFLTVSADEKGYQTEVFPYLVKIQIPEHPMQHYVVEKEEPKQKEVTQAESETDESQEQQVTKEKKKEEKKRLQHEREEPKYTYADRRRRSNDDGQRLHRIALSNDRHKTELHEKLDQITEELNELKRLDNLPQETIQTIDKTLDGVNTLLKQTIPGR